MKAAREIFMKLVREQNPEKEDFQTNPKPPFDAHFDVMTESFLPKSATAEEAGSFSCFSLIFLSQIYIPLEIKGEDLRGSRTWIIKEQVN